MPLIGQAKRDYDVAYRNRRREEWIDQQGRVCRSCGDTDGPFEVDHIDPSTKLYRITTVWTRTRSVRETELAKCQLLCESCHQIKSNSENSVELEHGDYNRGYRKGCRCSLCMSSVAPHWRSYRERKGSNIPVV